MSAPAAPDSWIVYDDNGVIFEGDEDSARTEFEMGSEVGDQKGDLVLARIEARSR